MKLQKYIKNINFPVNKKIDLFFYFFIIDKKLINIKFFKNGVKYG
jgi:hypothetical protein